MGILKTGLALGGGGARGAAHIGILQVFHEHGLHVDTLSGSSAGAIIGAMYAAKRDPYWIEERFNEFLADPVFKTLGTERLADDHDPDSVFGQFAKSIRDQVVIMMARNRPAIIRREKLEKCIEFLLPVRGFDELELPLKAVTADLQTGRTVVYDSGNLIEAVTQSSSIPGFVPPLEKDDMLLVDGGISAPTPVNQLLGEADFIIASDISKRITQPLRKRDIIEISLRAEQVTSLQYNAALLQNADYVIRPEVLGLHWSRFDRFDELVKAGRQAAEAEIDNLLQAIKKRASWTWRLRNWWKK